MTKQKTIRRAISCSGIGLHSGEEIRMRIIPAPEGSGIVFVRTDLDALAIPADPAHIVSTYLSTTIGAQGATVQTVEHLLAAISAMEIDNLIVELDGAEVPVFDGSSAPFVSLLLEAGTKHQEKEKHFIKVTEPITVSEGGKYITIRPASSLTVSYHIDFDHPLISKQSYRYRHSCKTFIKEIAPARTFGFLKEVESLQAQGLARGGSLENAIVIGEDRILNTQGLRFPDEFVRHKILDLVGDLSLLGASIQGEIDAFCSGHQLHTKLIREILEHQSSWKISGAPIMRPRKAPLSYKTASLLPLSS